MPPYLARDTLLPRAFIYASNEDALVVQSALPETRITLINSRGSNTLDPIFHLSASNNIFKIIQTSNNIASFYYTDNTSYLSVPGTTVTRSVYLEDPKKRQLVLYDTNTNDAFSGIGYTGGNMTFQIPSTATTGYLFQAANGAQNVPLVQINYDTTAQETRFGIGNPYPTKALDVYGDIYSTGTLVASNLRIIGQTTILDTVTSNTEQIVVTNSGDGPALHVTQTGANTVAEFYDGNEIVLMIDDNRKVGINTMYARNDFDVYGSAIISGNLGIGTVIPRAPIDVIGDIQYSGNLYKNGELVITSTFTSWVIDASSNSYNIIGNVGIGTTIVPELLTIYNGNILTNKKYISSYTDGAPFSLQSTYLNSNLNSQYLNYKDSSYYRNVDNMNAGVLPSYRGGTGSNYQSFSKLLVGGGASNPLFSPNDLHWDLTSNYLGIGVTTPLERVHLEGNLLQQTSNHTLFTQRTFGNQQTVSHFFQNKESFGYLSLDTHLKLWSYSNTSSILLGTNDIERVRINPYGNVGIGTTLPLTKLHVVGDQSLMGNLGIGTTGAPIGLYIYTRDAIRVPNGSTAERPQGQLGYIRYNSQIGQFEGFGPGNQWGSLSTVQSVNGDTYLIPEYTPGNDDKAIHFYTSNIEHMTLDRNGNLGIGSTSPQVRLVVTGTDAIQIPRGTTAERPINPGKGYIRFNTTIDKFEGYGENNTWGSVGGVRSVNGDTYITAESTPGTDDKTIRMYTNSTIQTVINAQGNVGIGTTLPVTPFQVQNQSYFVGNVGIGTAYPTSTLSVGTGPSDVTSTIMLNSGDAATNTDKIYLTYVKNGSRIGHYAGWNVTFYAGQSNTSASSTNGNFRFLTGAATYNEQFTILNGGNVGIGSTQPNYKLDVAGNTYVKGNILAAGNVGIGTLTPVQGLHVQQTSYFVGNVGIGTTVPLYPLDVYGGIKVGQGASTPADSVLLTLDTQRAWRFVQRSSGAATALALQCISSGKNFYLQDSSGNNFASFYAKSTSDSVNSNASWFLSAGIGTNYSTTTPPTNSLIVQSMVGIGTSMPREALEVYGANTIISGNVGIGTNIPQGNLYIGGATTPNVVFGGDSGGNTITIKDTSYVRVGSDQVYKTHILLAGESYGGGDQGRINLRYKNYVAFDNVNGVSGTGTERVRIDSVGNLGIGTTAPREKLEVQGSELLSGSLGIGTITPLYPLDVNGHGILRGNIGIGTTLINSPIDVWINQPVEGIANGIQMTTSTANITYNSVTGTALSMNIIKPQGLLPLTTLAKISYGSKYATYGSGSENNGVLFFDTANNGTLSTKMTITGDGLIGIGTTQPINTLDVLGKGYFAGNVGIGTTASLSPLMILASGNNFSGETLRLTGSSASGNTPNSYYLKFRNISPGASLMTHHIDVYNVDTTYTALTFERGNVGIGTTRARYGLDVYGGHAILSGNVGIGTTIPADNLYVNGNITYKGVLKKDETTRTADNVSGDRYTKIAEATRLSTGLLEITYSGVNRQSNKVLAFVSVPNGYDTASQTASKPTLQIISSTGYYFNELTSLLLITNPTDVTKYDIYAKTNTTTRANSDPGTTNTLSTRLIYGNISLVTPSEVTALPTSGNYADPTSYPYIVSVPVENVSFAVSAGYIGINKDEYALNGLCVVNGNIGIGTSSPVQELHVQGKGYISGNLGIGTTIPREVLDVVGTTLTTKIGVNTLTPSTQLHVVGNSLLYGNVGINTTTVPYSFYVHSSDHILVSQNGKLAISKSIPSVPTSELDIVSTAPSSSNCGILLRNSVNTTPTPSLRILANRYDGDLNAAYAANIGLARYNMNYNQLAQCPLGAIHFGGNHTNGSIDNVAYMASIQGIADGAFSSVSSAPTSLGFYTGSNAYLLTDTTTSTKGNEVMRITYDGKVGIQTKSPLYTLDVRGNSIITGNVGIGTTITQAGLTVYQDSYLGSGMNGEYNSYNGGPFYKQKKWDTAGTTHTVSFPEYCVADNSSGTLHIQVKSATNNKLGNVSLSFLKAYGNNVDTFSIYYHKTDNLTTFSLAVSGNNIIVTTDSDCSMSWSSIGAC